MISDCKVKLEYGQKVKKDYVSIPEFLSPQLAYFIGYLQGDGCLESNMKRVTFTEEDIEQINLINGLAFALFNVVGKVRERFPKLSKKVLYNLEIGSVDVHKFLGAVFNIPVGVKKDLSIPSIVKENKTLLRWYLCGLFDADGTLPKEASAVRYPFIDITLKDKAFIEEIRTALLDFGIVTLKPYRRLAKSPNSNFISETWELRIRKKSDMIRFINEVGFFSKAKNDRATRLLRRLSAAVAQPGYVRH
jgi:hypothetical protein